MQIYNGKTDQNKIMMKSTYKMITAVFVLLFTFSACDEDKLLELNVNKNAVTDMDMSYLFSYATLRIGAEYENTRALMLYASTMIQHTSSLASYFSGDKYYYNAQYSGAYMETQYTNVIKLLQHVINETADVPEQANLNAASMVLKAYVLQRMTDLYGDIPYSQAGNGLVSQEYWFPAYDPQQSVYYAMMDDVKAARDKFSATANPLGIQDFIYSGDIDLWKKFANALLMRMALRISNVDAAKAEDVFTEAYAGAFESVSDNAMIHYAEGPQGVNRNGLNDGYWNTYKYSKDCKVSKTFIDWMLANNDPRLMIITGGIGDPESAASWITDPAAQRGMPNGYTASTIKNVLDGSDDAVFDAQGNKMFSMLNIKYMDWSDPYLLITYGETELMKAEAAVKGWISGDAAVYFANGVKGAIDSWADFDAGFVRTNAEIADYISGRGFAAASNNDKLRLIGEEYWAATYLNDIESYANWRRTGYPALTPTQDPNRYEANEIPRRLKYWESEIANNPTNYASAIGRMGGDDFMTRVWWDGGN